MKIKKQFPKILFENDVLCFIYFNTFKQIVSRISNWLSHFEPRFKFDKQREKYGIHLVCTNTRKVKTYINLN